MEPEGIRSLRSKSVRSDAHIDYSSFFYQLKFIQRLKIHGRNTRCSGELDLPICRLKKEQRSFALRGAKLYNNLPNEIKQISDVKKLKAKVCNYLLNF